MKRFLVLLIALAMVMAIFVGCQKETTDTIGNMTDEPEDTTVAEDNTSDQAPDVKETPKPGEGEKVYVNDTAVLNLDWWAGIGTDSKFESPYRDLQSLYPHMLFGTLVKMDP